MISDKYFCLLLLLRKVLVVCLSDLLIFGPGLSFFFGLGTRSPASFHDCVFSCDLLHEGLFVTEKKKKSEKFLP